MPTDSNTSILVTGGTGLLGSHLLRHLLQQGYTNITALRRANSPMDLVADIQDRIHWQIVDILEVRSLEEAMNGIQKVYHCAGLVSFNPRHKDQMMDININGTANIVNAALFMRIEKLVHVSSIAAIGRRPKLSIITEKTRWERSKWNSKYALSKYLGEMEVWRGQAEGLKIAIINPSVILGNGYWHKGTGQLFNRVWNGLKFYPIGMTGYVDVKDVAQFMVQLMESEIEGERFILNSENLSYLELFTKIAKTLKKTPPSTKVSFLMREIAIISDWLRALFTNSSRLITRASANHVNRRFRYDNTKSKAVFDFEYRTIEQTIKEVGAAFLKTKKG